MEIYHKFNATIKDQRELHGNVILEALLNSDDRVRMGFLFSPDPESGAFDGLQVDVHYTPLVVDFKPVFSGGDIWTKTRPFADGSIKKAELT